MAEEPIRKDDIMDFEGTKAAFNDLIATVEKLSTVLHKDLKTSADEWLKSLNGINIATKEGQEVLNNAAAATGTLVAQEKELTKLDKEKIQLQARLNALNTETASSNAQLKVQIERKNRELKEEKKLYDSAHGSVNEMRKKLKDLTEEYNRLAPALRNKVAPEINKVASALKKAESAIGSNTRNVGNYKQAIMDAGKQLFGFAGIVATATATLNQLKNTLEETDIGSDFFSTFKAGVKGMLQSFVGGEKSFKEIIKSFPKAAQAQSQLNQIRKRDREDLVVISRMETDLSILRYKAADATLSEREQLNYLQQAQAKEDELIAYKIKDKQEELTAYKKLLEVEKDDITVKDKIASLEAEIISLEGDKNLRIQSRATSLREKLGKDRLKQVEEEKRLAQLQMDGVNGLTIAKLQSNAKIDIELDKSRQKQLIQNEDFYAQQVKTSEEAYDRIIDEENRVKELKGQILQDSLTVMSNSLTTFGNLYEAQKQRELSAAGDNAVKREEIERKYAKRQQALSVGQALINGAMAITEIWKKWAANPVLAGVFTALASAQTIAQVAVIKSQKFARGGSGVLGGNVHASGGVQIPGIGEAERGEHFSIINRGATNKYGSSMLDAVSSSINQGKFFEVWSNANKSMGSGDPYTKKMFDLMTRTPVVYADSEGNTIKDFVATGQKQVIRKNSRRRKRAYSY